MKTNYVLVDFENVQPDNMELLRGGLFKIKVFVGSNQKISVDVAKSLQAFGPDAEYIQIEGNGKNALDFHIAYYIGRLAGECADAYFHVISKDTGFDPLMQHLKDQKINCRRSPSVGDIPFIKKGLDTKTMEEQTESVTEWLKKSTKPRTEKTLTSTIKGLFAKQPCDEQVAAILKELQKRKVITVTDGKISYSLPS